MLKNIKDFIRKNHVTKLTFYAIATIIWISAYIMLFVPNMNNYYLTNPQASQMLGFLINIGFIFVSIFLLAFILDGIIFALKFASGMCLNIVGITLIQSPLCLSPVTGQILLTPTNASCSWAMDIFFSNILKFFGMTGYSLYAYTYIIFGSILMIAGGIVLFYSISKKIHR